MLAVWWLRKIKTLGVNKEGGVPDGMTLDHEGRIWTPLCGGSAVICIDPESGDELHRYLQDSDAALQLRVPINSVCIVQSLACCLYSQARGINWFYAC